MGIEWYLMQNLRNTNLESLWMGYWMVFNSLGNAAISPHSIPSFICFFPHLLLPSLPPSFAVLFHPCYLPPSSLLPSLPPPSPSLLPFFPPFLLPSLLLSIAPSERNIFLGWFRMRISLSVSLGPGPHDLDNQLTLLVSPSSSSSSHSLLFLSFFPSSSLSFVTPLCPSRTHTHTHTHVHPY